MGALIILVFTFLLYPGFKYLEIFPEQHHTTVEIISMGKVTTNQTKSTIKFFSPEITLKILKIGVENIASNILIIKLSDGSLYSQIIPIKLHPDIIKLNFSMIEIQKNESLDTIVWIVALYGKQTPYHTSKVELINRTYTLEELRERT